MHANSETKKSVRQAKNTVKTNAKLMSALAQQNIFRTKICEKSHVFRDIDFGRLLGEFGRVWETQILDFSSFFDVISKQNLKRVSDRQKIAKNVCLGGVSFYCFLS